MVLVSIVLLAIFFVITGIATTRYHAELQAYGGRWYQRGEAALKADRPEEAVDDFHTALVYARNNTGYQMLLAQALVRANRLAEAEAQLRTLWERQPGSGQVNLELARLFSKSHNVSEAIHYYHTAVFGAWEVDPGAQRRHVRVELCKFLLKEGEKNAAESELIALQTELPADTHLHAEVGNMFMQVQDYRRALEEFRQAIKLNPKQADAWAGAGDAAYQLADYAQARRYLQRAVDLDRRNLGAAQKLEISKLVLELDPFGRRLSQEERSRRTVAAFSQALSHLKQCAKSRDVNLLAKQASGPLAEAYSTAKKEQPKVTRINLVRHPDLINNVMDVVTQMEEAAQQACGTPPLPDQALLMISHSRGVTER